MSGHRIVMLKAYDAMFAGYAAASDVDILLVGDSLGMVSFRGTWTPYQSPLMTLLTTLRA